MEKKPFHAACIDGLRAVAVLSVIAYHLNSRLLPGGFAGVDVFFVISGFVVALSVSELGDIGLRRFLTYFYARRLSRIAPALVVMLLATFLASALFIPTAWLSLANQKTGLFAFAGLSNFILAANTGNYFSPVAEFNPFTHTWSLAVEEQFYLCFPLIFIFWLSGRRRISIGLFSAALVASFVCAIWLGRTNETQAFYMMWSRFWELGIGVLLFQVMHARGHSFDDPSPYNAKYAVLGDIGLLALGAGLIVARPELAPFPACVLPVAGTAVLIGTLHGRRGGVAWSILTWRPMIFIGKISYSLYLWHWPVFVLFRWTTGLSHLRYQFAALALTLALSVASFYFVERPFRYLRSKGIRHWQIVAAGIAFLGLTGAVAAKIDSAQRELSVSTVMRNYDDWYPGGSNIASNAQGCQATETTTGLLGSPVITYGRAGCDAPISGPRVFAIGDSHALAFAAMYRQYALNTGAQVTVYGNGGCPYLSLMQWRDDACKPQTDAAIADMKTKMKPGDVLFLPSLRLPRFTEHWERFKERDVYEEMQSYTDGRRQAVELAKKSLAQFDATGIHIVMELPLPEFHVPFFRCADSYTGSNPVCDASKTMGREKFEAFRKPVVDSLHDVVAGIPNATTWDPFPVICPPGPVCNGSMEGRPLFFDGDHISGYGDGIVEPSFEKAMAALMNH